VLRTALVDLEIAVSLRFNELRIGQQQALHAARTAHSAEMQRCIVGLSRRLADKDLTGHGAGPVPDDCADVFADLDAAIASLRQSLTGTRDRTSKAEGVAGRIALSAAALADGASATARSARTAVSELTEIGLKAGRTAAGVKQAEQATAKAQQTAVASGQIVSEAIAAMSDIERSAERIGQIIGVIDDIAFQTNLLALNAGIEAARAGETGRGFAVVAQEVRALAQRSADAAREIKQLVTTTKSQVDGGVQMVGRTQSAIGGIVDQVSAINEMIAAISVDAGETSLGIEHAAHGISALGSGLDRLELGGAETRGHADELHAVILELGETIREFRLAKPHSRSLPPGRPRPRGRSPWWRTPSTAPSPSRCGWLCRGGHSDEPARQAADGRAEKQHSLAGHPPDSRSRMACGCR
jgi:methyl-accepting chemotaxis protein